MKILNNIVANCSDFVWSLDKTEITEIRTALKGITLATGWGLYACPESFNNGIFIPVAPEDVEILEYEEDNDNHTELGVPVEKIPVCKKYIEKNRDKSTSPFSDLMTDLINKRQFVPIVFARINHLPNKDGVHYFNGMIYRSIPVLRVNYSCGYCGSKCSISDNQPQPRELEFFGEILKNIGGTFHHEDGGYSQADWHAKWFNENGYESIVESGDGDPDNCDEDTE